MEWRRQGSVLWYKEDIDILILSNLLKGHFLEIEFHFLEIRQLPRNLICTSLKMVINIFLLVTSFLCLKFASSKHRNDIWNNVCNLYFWRRSFLWLYPSLILLSYDMTSPVVRRMGGLLFKKLIWISAYKHIIWYMAVVPCGAQFHKESLACYKYCTIK